MLQMVMKAGEDEKVMDLVDTPEFVLRQSCDMILRHQDMRNPDAQRMVQDIISALKVKATKESDEPGALSRYNLKSYIMQVDDLLLQFA